MNLIELYQEIFLDHGKNPRNLRKTENFNKDAKGHNPLCGDKVHVYLKLNENKKVEDLSFSLVRRLMVRMLKLSSIYIFYCAPSVCQLYVHLKNTILIHCITIYNSLCLWELKLWDNMVG